MGLRIILAAAMLCGCAKQWHREETCTRINSGPTVCEHKDSTTYHFLFFWWTVNR